MNKPNIASTKRKLDESEFASQVIINDWYKKAKTTPIDEFYKEVMSYEHDYGTIIHAINVMIKCAFYSVENSDQGGITGAQFGFIEGFVSKFNDGLKMEYWFNDEKHQNYRRLQK
jgi:hypothetical protein